MMPKGRALALVVAGLVAGGAATTGVMIKRGSTTPEEAAAGAARDACVHVRRFERIVEQNGPVTEATEELARAERFARRAAERDPRWLPLSGGIQTLQAALNADDAGSADIGIRVVTVECASTR